MPMWAELMGWTRLQPGQFGSTEGGSLTSPSGTLDNQPGSSWGWTTSLWLPEGLLLVLTPGHLPLFPPLLGMFSRSELAQRPGHAETCCLGLGKVGEALLWAWGQELWQVWTWQG